MSRESRESHLQRRSRQRDMSLSPRYFWLCQTLESCTFVSNQYGSVEAPRPIPAPSQAPMSHSPEAAGVPGFVDDALRPLPRTNELPYLRCTAPSPSSITGLRSAQATTSRIFFLKKMGEEDRSIVVAIRQHHPLLTQAYARRSAALSSLERVAIRPCCRTMGVSIIPGPDQPSICFGLQGQRLSPIGHEWEVRVSLLLSFSLSLSLSFFLLSPGKM